MRPVLIQPPAAAVITYDEAKRHLNLDSDDSKALIELYIATAVGMLDPAAGAPLFGRSLAPATWELRQDGFHWCSQIVLPYPPLIEVVSLKYDDAEGVERVVEAGGYRVLMGEDGLSRLAPPIGGSWPAARADNGSVRVRFTAGYPVTGEGDDAVAAVPPPIKTWLLRQVATLNENRESVSSAGQTAPQPMPEFDKLIDRYRIWA